MEISEIVKMFLVVACFGGFFLLLDRMEKRKAFSSELNRKILHIGSGFGGLCLPFLFGKKLPVIILGIFFLLIFIVIRLVKHKATGLKDVIEIKGRRTFGDIYFIMSILGLWVSASHDRVMYSLPIVILMFSDAFAALIGKFYSKYRFDTGFGTKSIEGSVIFLITTYSVCVNFFLLFSSLKNMDIILLSLLLGILTMILEVISWNGLDNLFIPFFVYLFLRQNLYSSTGELKYKFYVIAVLFIIVILNRKKTTLTRTAQTASLFFMYLVTTLGGISWLIPPLAMYLGYYHFTPKVEGQTKDSLKGLLSIAASTFMWLAILPLVQDVFQKDKLFIIYTFAFSLHFGIINMIRYDASHGKEEKIESAIGRFRIFHTGTRKSIGKAFLFFSVSYILSFQEPNVIMLLIVPFLMAGGMFLYKSVVMLLKKAEYGEKLNGEKRVFISSASVFVCSFVLFIVGMF